jgi:hypothetical protein
MDPATPSLTDAIKASAGRLTPKLDARPRQRSGQSMTQSVKNVATRERRPPATRSGRKGIVVYVDQRVAAAIRRLASEYDATNQELGEMAFKFLFEKFGEAWPA